MKRDLRRINNQQFSVRTLNICKGLGIKTINGIITFNWDSIMDTRIKMGNGYPIIMKAWRLRRIMEEVEELKMTVQETEFMEYWLEQDDENIVSFLWEILADERLNKVINVEDTIDIDEYDETIFAVFQVIYKPGQRRKHLIELIRQLDKELN